MERPLRPGRQERKNISADTLYGILARRSDRAQRFSLRCRCQKISLRSVCLRSSLTLTASSGFGSRAQPRSGSAPVSLY